MRIHSKYAVLLLILAVVGTGCVVQNDPPI